MRTKQKYHRYAMHPKISYGTTTDVSAHRNYYKFMKSSIFVFHQSVIVALFTTLLHIVLVSFSEPNASAHVAKVHIKNHCTITMEVPNKYLDALIGIIFCSVLLVSLMNFAGSKSQVKIKWEREIFFKGQIIQVRG